uniref:DDE-1 domain-containing protein n=1 Tax=Daphnia galeata TaxID=27404 RepID=A0A8J2WIE6_9CRUS|nr:unnamed protein product [Daphnia galeata]
MSHLDYQAVTFAKEHGIILLTFPPHCSHALQPCDVNVFGPFKRACGKSQNDWLHLHPGERISIKHIAELSTGTFQEAFPPKNIIAGFKATEFLIPSIDLRSIYKICFLNLSEFVLSLPQKSPFASLINLSLSSGVFPDSMKLASIASMPIAEESFFEPGGAF